MKNIISEITMKELGQTIYRALQKSFSEAMANILLEMDDAIAEARDKSRFKLKDKRPLSFYSQRKIALLGRVGIFFDGLIPPIINWL